MDDLNDIPFDGPSDILQKPVVLDNHSLGHARRKLRLEACQALSKWFSCYDMVVHLEDGQRVISDDFDEPMTTYYYMDHFLNFARDYHWQVEPAARPSANILQPPTDAVVRDFCRDFEAMCAATAPADRHVLVWRTLASHCRGTSEHAWLHLVDFMKESSIEYPASYDPAAARVSDFSISDKDYQNCLMGHKGVDDTIEASGFPELDEDRLMFDVDMDKDDPAMFSDTIGAVGNIYTAAAEFCTPAAVSLTPAQVKTGLDDVCTSACDHVQRLFYLYTQGPYANTLKRGSDFLFGLRALEAQMPIWPNVQQQPEIDQAFAQHALHAMRAFCHLIRTPDVKLFGATAAWVFHMLRVRCEWEVAEIMAGNSSSPI